MNKVTLTPISRIKFVIGYLESQGLTIEDEPILQLGQAIAELERTST